MIAIIAATLLSASAAFAEPHAPFAFDLYRQVAAAHPGKNVLISPSSARWALGMAYSGAQGATQEAMARVLGALSPSENVEAESARIGSLLSADPQVKLRIANSVWLKRGFPFRKDYRAAVTVGYHAEVFERDFGPSAVVEANNWVAKITSGRITSILKGFEPEDRALLINAVYFKGKWTDPFKAKETTEEDFHIATGKTVKRKLMDRVGEYPYYEGSGFQAVRLPYGDGRLGMIVLLPAPDASLQSLDSAAANPEGWARVRAGLRERTGRVRLPRFKLEFEAPLKVPLTALGMGIAFDRKMADFSAMTDASRGLCISDVLQKTFVEVNEKGTEAAAVTAYRMAALTSAVPAKAPFVFVADRPFLYAIEDRETQEILFLGALHDPR